MRGPWIIGNYFRGEGGNPLIKDEAGNSKLGFEFLEGPITPKAESIPEKRVRKPRKPSVKKKPSGPKDDGGGDPPRGGTVPKVPLVIISSTFSA